MHGLVGLCFPPRPWHVGRQNHKVAEPRGYTDQLRVANSLQQAFRESGAIRRRELRLQLNRPKYVVGVFRTGAPRVIPFALAMPVPTTP